MFQLPAVILSILIASILAAAFYLWQGRTLRQFGAYWAASMLGFLAGQWAASALGSRILMIGQVHPLEGLVLAAAALLVVKLLRL